MSPSEVKSEQPTRNGSFATLSSAASSVSGGTPSLDNHFNFSSPPSPMSKDTSVECLCELPNKAQGGNDTRKRKSRRVKVLAPDKRTASPSHHHREQSASAQSTASPPDMRTASPPDHPREQSASAQSTASPPDMRTASPPHHPYEQSILARSTASALSTASPPDKRTTSTANLASAASATQKPAAKMDDGTYLRMISDVLMVPPRVVNGKRTSVMSRELNDLVRCRVGLGLTGGGLVYKAKAKDEIFDYRLTDSINVNPYKFNSWWGVLENGWGYILILEELVVERPKSSISSEDWSYDMR